VRSILAEKFRRAASSLALSTPCMASEEGEEGRLHGGFNEHRGVVISTGLPGTGFRQPGMGRGQFRATATASWIGAGCGSAHRRRSDIVTGAAFAG